MPFAPPPPPAPPLASPLPPDVLGDLLDATWRGLEANDVERWFEQGFVLDAASAVAPFGLMQRSGGPCGVLAAVQAFMLCRLLFTDDLTAAEARFGGADADATGGDAGEPSGTSTAAVAAKLAGTTRAELDAALAHAIAFALWQAREEERPALVLTLRDAGAGAPAPAALAPPAAAASASAGSPAPAAAAAAADAGAFFTPATPASAFEVWSLATFSDVEVFVASPRVAAQLSSRSGVAQLLLSVMLTRTLRGVGADQDEPTPLVARFGHCSQDLLNLLLTGRATSNAFDGAQDMGGGLSLRGVAARPLVGYLSTLEALRYLQVGAAYKTPLLPVWVVGSESHFSLLWGADTAVNQESPSAPLFKAFKTADAHDAQFIAVADLGRVLAALRLPLAGDLAAVAALAAQLETEGCGIITWASFYAGVAPLCDSMRKQPAAAGAGAGAGAGAAAAALPPPPPLARVAPPAPSAPAGAPAAAEAAPAAASGPAAAAAGAGAPRVSAAALHAAFTELDTGGGGFLLLNAVAAVLGRAGLAQSAVVTAEPAMARKLNPDRDSPQHVIVLWDDLLREARAAGLLRDAAVDAAPAIVAASAAPSAGGHAAAAAPGQKRRRRRPATA